MIIYIMISTDFFLKNIFVKQNITEKIPLIPWCKHLQYYRGDIIPHVGSEPWMKGEWTLNSMAHWYYIANQLTRGMQPIISTALTFSLFSPKHPQSIAIYKIMKKSLPYSTWKCLNSQHLSKVCKTFSLRK